MSVPRKRRLPAWHLLTDEGGMYEFTISVCSISFGHTGTCGGRGARTARSCPVGDGDGATLHPPAAAEIPHVVGLDLTHCLRGVRAFARSRDHLCAWSRLRVSASCWYGRRRGPSFRSDCRQPRRRASPRGACASQEAPERITTEHTTTRPITTQRQPTQNFHSHRETPSD